ncbi:EAL domain-containing protein [Vibrio sp. PNB22_3_1]
MKSKSNTADLILALKNGAIPNHLQSVLQPKYHNDLATQASKLSLFFEITDRNQHSIVVWNRSGIIYANKTFESNTGFALQELMGQPISSLVANHTNSGFLSSIEKQLKNGYEWNGVVIATSRDKADIVVNAHIFALPMNTRDTFYVCVSEIIREQESAKAEIHQLTNFDDLTNLPNRALFIKTTQSEIDAATNLKKPFGVLFIDVDKFKLINDTCGHAFGDHALITIARRLQSVITCADMAARVGGDEFAILHRNATPESLQHLAMVILNALSEPVTVKATDIPIGASIGSALSANQQESITDVLSHADLAMYHAKKTKVGYFPYNEELGQRFKRETEIARALPEAISDDQLRLVYQPKFDLTSNQTNGVEALIRWDSPTLSTVSPSEFIKIAERHHQIVDIGNWVVNKACCDIKALRLMNQDVKGRVAINISMQQFEHPQFLPTILNIIDQHKMTGDEFELEVTESLLMRDPEATKLTIDKLKRQGFHIAIDDFGTGFSSLAYLKDIAADTLKVDKSFVDTITHCQENQTIVHSIIELSKNLGMKVVAEGIETSEQKETLFELGCETGQGFYYSKPLEISDLFELLQNESVTTFNS